jgi:hypothetical protein
MTPADGVEPAWKVSDGLFPQREPLAGLIGDQETRWEIAAPARVAAPSAIGKPSR